MASNSTASLVQPDGYALLSSNNSITSKWADKRSATNCSISFVLAGSNAPTGTLTIETSNAPENYNSSYGSGPLVPTPGSDPLDVTTYTGSSTAISAAGATKFDDIITSARWIRAKYVSSSNVAGLTVNCWINVPFESA
jgi:hypothetical protein